MKTRTIHLISMVVVLTLVAAACGQPASRESGDIGVGAPGVSSPSGCGIPGYDPDTDETPPSDPDCSGEPGSGDDGVVSGGSDDPGSPGDGRPQTVTPRPGMADVRPVSWTKARVVDSGNAVRLFFWSGVEPCNVLDRVDVEYGTRSITLTLFEGHDASAGDVACIEIAVSKVVEVELVEPVDGRQLVDGAR